MQNYKTQSTGFYELMVGDKLNNLWINISEFLSSLYHIFAAQINMVNPIVHRLTPILECFFIIYNIAIDDQKHST